MLEKRILSFGNNFHGRLDKIWLDSAMDYINYDEISLAFEELCYYLNEYDVSLSKEEFSDAEKLALDMGFDISKPPFNYLKGLVK